MPDERLYEQLLINAIIAWQNEQQNASRYIEGIQKGLDIHASIRGRIADLTGVSASDADAYINYTYGQFRPGKHMTHCTDSQLQQMFALLEKVVNEVNKYPYPGVAEAEKAVKDKSNKMIQLIDEIKRIFEINTARGITSRAKAKAISITGIKF